MTTAREINTGHPLSSEQKDIAIADASATETLNNDFPDAATTSESSKPQDAKLNNSQVDASSNQSAPNRPVTLWWDYDNVTINGHDKIFESGPKIIANLTKFAMSCGSGEIEMKVFSNLQNLGQTATPMIDMFQNHNVEFIPVTAMRHQEGRSENVDKQMIAAITKKSQQEGSQSFIIITGDTGFAKYISALKHKNTNNDIYLIFPQYTPPDFIDLPCWTKTFAWEQFKYFTPNIVGLKHICVHFSRNKCTVGNSCKFLHMCSVCNSQEHGAVNCPQNKAPKPPCGYFNRGRCRLGKDCNLDHKCLKCGTVGERRCMTCRAPQNAINEMPSSPALTDLVLHTASPGAQPAPRCEEKTFCQAALKCKNAHTERELKIFRMFNGGMQKYRTAQCRFGEDCPKRGTCTYAHNRFEYVCQYCAGKGDHLGRNCPEREKDEELELKKVEKGKVVPLDIKASNNQKSVDSNRSKPASYAQSVDSVSKGVDKSKAPSSSPSETSIINQPKSAVKKLTFTEEKSLKGDQLKKDRKIKTTDEVTQLRAKNSQLSAELMDVNSKLKSALEKNSELNSELAQVKVRLESVNEQNKKLLDIIATMAAQKNSQPSMAQSDVSLTPVKASASEQKDTVQPATTKLPVPKKTATPLTGKLFKGLNPNAAAFEIPAEAQSSNPSLNGPAPSGHDKNL